MSQNSHTLLLFFSKEELYKKCFQILRLLETGKPDQANKIGQDLGVNIAHTWSNLWFNQKISPTPKFIRIEYETSTGYDLPLDILQQLFDAGLRAACLEVFYDQVGEFSHFYFMDGQLVDKNSICNKFGLMKTIIGEEFECDNKELKENGYRYPIPISELIKKKVKQEKEAREMVDTLLGLTKASRETGINPLELAESALILRAAGKGLLQGIGFGAVTILLFKGIWFWICLSIALSIILPLIYTSKVSAEFNDEENSEGKEIC